MNTRYFDRLDYIYKMLVIIALVITATILLRDLVIPLAFAGLLSVVMLPAVKKIEKKTGPTWAIIIVLVGGLAVFGFLGWLLVNQVINLANDLPNLESKATNVLNQASHTLRHEFNISTSDQTKLIQDVLRNISMYIGNFLLTTSNTLSTLLQIPIYIFLFLIYRQKFKLFFLNLVPSKNDELLWRKDVEQVIQGYISGLLLVTLIVAALNTIGLLALGIDHAIFFGILSGVLTIIPYIGIFIGALLPVLMALITKDSYWYTLGVIIVFTVVQFLEGNFITPRITGSKVSINALAAIIALIIAGNILGIAGMILAVPAIGILKIVLSYSEHLKPFVILLGDVDPQEKRKDPTENTPQMNKLKKELIEKDKKEDGVVDKETLQL
jgi:predicted PurR-regulated permease PerM